MSEMTMAPDESRRLVDDEPTSQAEMVTEPFASTSDAQLLPAPTLISEHEVMLGTAAAVKVQPTRWWTVATRVLSVPLRRGVASRSARPQRRHVPSRASYLEYSRMAREMHRL